MYSSGSSNRIYVISIKSVDGKVFHACMTDHQMPFPTDLKFSAMMVVMCGQGNMGWMFMCHVFKW